MRSRGSSLFLRWGSLLFVLLAAVLTVLQVVQYSLSRANYPPDMTIGEVPVGGLDPQAASQRLLEVYSTPIEIQYGSAVIDLDPALVSFQLNLDSMLAEADLQRTGASFWSGFWDYLWSHRAPARQIPLVATYSEDRLRVFLQNEISTRYDQPPTPAQPIPGTANYTPGSPGQALDIERSVILIEAALRSPSQRTVIITSQSTASGRPSLGTVQVQLKQIIDQSGFDGLTDVYFRDLQTSEVMNFAYQAGQDISVSPTDIAFSGASTIKIPILVSVFRYFNSHIDEITDTKIKNMLNNSANYSDGADGLMAEMDPVRGPLVVYETMKILGLKNTFISMYFAKDSFPLDHIMTEANSRLDINTDPDPEIQTTPSDMGMLLEDLYICSQTGGGSLIAAFPGQIDQAACQQMVLYLQGVKLGNLIEAGLPEGTTIANKYGWDNAINNISDAAIIYTPGGDYILTIYVYSPTGYIWNVASPMIAEISRAVYNYFNLPAQ